MALVDHDQFEELARHVFERLVGFLLAGDRLVQREMDLVSRIELVSGHFHRRRAERLEVVDQRLVDEDVSVHEKQRPLDVTCLPQTPDDLERRIGLTRPGRHDEQNAALSCGDRLDRAIDGLGLIVAGLLAARVLVIGLEHQRLRGVLDSAMSLISFPHNVGRREPVQRQQCLDILRRTSRLVV